MYGNDQKSFHNDICYYHLDSVNTTRFLEIRISVNSAIFLSKECELSRKVSRKESYSSLKSEGHSEMVALTNYRE